MRREPSHLPDMALCTARPEENAALHLVFDLQRLRRESDGPYWRVPIGAGKASRNVIVACARGGGPRAGTALVQDLVERYDLAAMVFSGVAASVASPDLSGRHLQLGDVVVATGVVPCHTEIGWAGEPGSAGFSVAAPREPSLLRFATTLAQELVATRDHPWIDLLDEVSAGRDEFRRPDWGPRAGGPQGERAGRRGRSRLHLGRVGSCGWITADPSARVSAIADGDLRAIEFAGPGAVEATAICNRRHIPWAMVKGICGGPGMMPGEWTGYASLAAAAFARVLLEQASAVPAEPGEVRARIIRLAEDLSAMLAALRRDLDQPDTQLREGILLKRRLRSFLREPSDEGARYQRHLASLMLDAMRGLDAEKITEDQVIALSTCVDQLPSEELGQTEIKECDRALCRAGLDSLPVPEGEA